MSILRNLVFRDVKFLQILSSDKTRFFFFEEDVESQEGIIHVVSTWKWLL